MVSPPLQPPVSGVPSPVGNHQTLIVSAVGSGTGYHQCTSTARHGKAWMSLSATSANKVSLSLVTKQILPSITANPEKVKGSSFVFQTQIFVYCGCSCCYSRVVLCFPVLLSANLMVWYDMYCKGKTISLHCTAPLYYALLHFTEQSVLW